jgi:hypothetical protein
MQGTMYGVMVSGFTNESMNNPFGLTAAGQSVPFGLFAIRDQSTNPALNLDTSSQTFLDLYNGGGAVSGNGATSFLRPEDGAWDPRNPGDYYFNTTAKRIDQGGKSRLWRLRFTDITNPALGGTLTVLLYGTEGHSMLDGMAIDKYGNILLQEDTGSSAPVDRPPKIWQYKISNGKFKELAKIDQDVYYPPTGPKYIARDSETSGLIDAADVLGPGWFLVDVQFHRPLKSVPFPDLYGAGVCKEVVEYGQLIAMYNPDSDPDCCW